MILQGFGAALWLLSHLTVSVVAQDSSYSGALYKEYQYWFYEERKTFDQAKSVCEGLRGSLAWIDSDEEMQWIKGKIQSVSGVDYWYNGLRNMENTNILQDYKWLNGKTAQYTNFAQGEPSHTYENCVAMDKSTGKWHDITCDRVEPSVCKTDFSLPDAHFEYNSHIYTFVPARVTNSNAEDFCKTLGGHLVWIEDQAEMNWMKGIMSEHYDSIPYFYIGLKDTVGRNRVDDYHWISGAEDNFKYFEPGEPGSDYELCAITLKVSGYKWGDITCDRLESFICKSQVQGTEPLPIA